MECLYFIFICW